MSFLVDEVSPFFLFVPPPPPSHSFCNVILWESPDYYCDGILIGYDVRFYDSNTQTLSPGQVPESGTLIFISSRFHNNNNYFNKGNNYMQLSWCMLCWNLHDLLAIFRCVQRRQLQWELEFGVRKQILT